MNINIYPAHGVFALLKEWMSHGIVITCLCLWCALVSLTRLTPGCWRQLLAPAPAYQCRSVGRWHADIRYCLRQHMTYSVGYNRRQIFSYYLCNQCVSLLIVELRTHTQSIPTQFFLSVKRVKNGFGAEIKIIFAPTPPTMKPFLSEMDSRAYFKTFLLRDMGSILQG